jgi:membrane-associated protease RseP (regulator of RpoE activity)
MRKMQWKQWVGLGAATLVLSAGLVAAAHAREETDETTPWLGVYTQSLSTELRDGMNYRGDGGVLVNRVVEGSPADEAGLRKGDVIVSVNSRSVDTPDALAEIVHSGSVGQRMAVQIVRDGDTKTLTARLAARRESDEETPTPEEGPRVYVERHDSEAPEAPETRVTPETPEPPNGPEAPEALRMYGGMAMGRGRLGVRVETLSPELGEYFNTPGGKGVLVMEVIKDTPAERAGLKAGDVITHVGRRAVYDSDDLVSALSDEQGRVSLTVVRKGERRTIETELARAPRVMRLDGNGLMGRDMIRMRRDLNDRQTPDRESRRSIQRDDSNDRDQMRREIEELRRQIDALQRELERDRN